MMITALIAVVCVWFGIRYERERARITALLAAHP